MPCSWALRLKWINESLEMMNSLEAKWSGDSAVSKGAFFARSSEMNVALALWQGAINSEDTLSWFAVVSENGWEQKSRSIQLLAGLTLVVKHMTQNKASTT